VHLCSPAQSIAEEDINSYVYRWRELFGQVEQWFESRSSQMKSIFTVTQPGYSGIEQPFPMVLYGNGATSALYMLRVALYTKANMT
jgi:hypothetical protein